MKKKHYRSIICNQTKMIKDLKEQNEALKKTCRANRRMRLSIIARLCDLSNRIGDECMMPESEVVQKCIEEVKKVYV